MDSLSDIQALKFNLNHIADRLKNSIFVKNILIVMSGTAIAQAIGFAMTPVISRLYSPADFGVFGSFNAVLSVIVAGATLEYSQAIMLPKEKGDAFNLFVVSCLCTLAIGIISGISCLLAPATLNGLMKTDGIWALVLLIVSVVVAGLNQSCQAWSVRAKAFKHTSGSQIIRSISSNGGRIGLGYLNGGAPGLIISSLLGDMLATLSLSRVIFPDIVALRHHIRWGSIKILANDYKDFPLYSSTQNVINSLSNGLPVLVLTQFFGIAVAGAYAFGVTVMQVPMSLILGALRQVLFQKAGETQNLGGRLTPLYVKTTCGLFSIVLLPSMILLLWAPQLFVWIFGSQWHMAGELARSLIIWISVAFCNLPAVLFARIIRIQRFVFFYDLVLLFARSLALVIGGLYLNALQTVMMFAVIGAIMNATLIYLVGLAVSKKDGVTF